MVPFIMRDPGDLRRQDLLTTGEHYALLNSLPAPRRQNSRSWQCHVAALSQVMRGLGSHYLRRAPVVAIAGEQR